MYYVYILQSKKDRKLYTGFTKDLKKRVAYHNNGVSVATKGRLPLDLIYYEVYANEKDARKREIFLKLGRGREVIRKQLDNTLKTLDKNQFN